VRPAALGGILAPLTTPFDAESGDVAPLLLRRAARDLIAAGLDGVVVAGSTGESALLDEAEKVRAVEWLREVVPEDRWLVAGTGAESTRASIRLAVAASSAGADAVLVRPPSYFATLLSPAALADHYRRVADASPVPVIVYNIPKFTHVMLQDSTLRALADHERIAGFKDSSGDLKVFAGFRAALPRVAALVGGGSLLYPALEMGAAGGVLGVACFAAKVCAALLAAFRAGDLVAAGALQERLTPLHKEIVAAMGAPGIKAAMEAVGLPGGPVRAPLQAIDAKQRARVAELLAAASLVAAA
jgi:4-hydroxy-2-oxoglutarate aldolase